MQPLRGDDGLRRTVHRRYVLPGHPWGEPGLGTRDIPGPSAGGLLEKDVGGARLFCRCSPSPEVNLPEVNKRNPGPSSSRRPPGGAGGIPDSVQIVSRDDGGCVTALQIGGHDFTGEEVQYALGLQSRLASRWCHTRDRVRAASQGNRTRIRPQPGRRQRGPGRGVEGGRRYSRIFIKILN